MASALRSPVSKLEALTATAADSAPRTSLLAVLAACAPPVSQQARVPQAYLLAAVGPPAAAQARSSQAQALIARSAGAHNVTARTSQAALLIAYGTGVPNDQRDDSWTFVADGHRFWVLPLGPEGDWAYDTVTKQWCQLNTQGFPGLNFRHGVMWKTRVMGADQLYPFLYELDPDQPDDEGWRPVEHIVTGGVQTRSPNMIGVANFRLAATPGHLSDATSTVELTYSDDNGNTWSDPVGIDVAQGAYDTQLVWSALGSFAAPGRIFKVTDAGGTLSLYGADVALNNYDEDDAGGSGNGG